jgi:hypothetical protein
MSSRYIKPSFDDPYPEGYAGQEILNVEFLHPLQVRRQIEAVKLKHGKEDANFIVAAPYRISYRLAGDPADKKRYIEVPRGMLTDLSSVPWYGRWWISQVGPHLEASIIHDFLYVAWQDLPDRKRPRSADRLFADKVLHAGMIDAEVSAVKRAIIYLAVRLGGWRMFKGRDRFRYYDFWSGEGALSAPADSPRAPVFAPEYLPGAPVTLAGNPTTPPALPSLAGDVTTRP